MRFMWGRSKSDWFWSQDAALIAELTAQIIPEYGFKTTGMPGAARAADLGGSS